MSLTLQIVSQQARAMGAAASFQFEEAGGSLGRIDGNDWILPDAERFVSSRHATVSCEGGMWYLTDTSTNGTFVNDPGFLIGNGNTVPLNEGDRLFVGDYEIVVSLASAAAPGPNVESAATNFSTDSFFTDAQAGPSAPASPGTGIDPSVPGAGQSLDPLDGLMGGGYDPYGAPASTPTGPQIPAGGPSYDENPELDPMAAFDTPDLSADVPQQEQWPQGAGATPDHVSPLDQHFNPPHASTGVIPEDWVDKTVFPDQPRAPSPPPQPAAPPAAAPTPPSAPSPPPVEPPAPPGPSPTGAYPQQAGTFSAPPQPTGTFQQPPQGTAAYPQPPLSEGTMQQPMPAIGEGSAEGLQRLLAAAGVDPARMPPQAANAVFQLAGSVFREVVEGIMEVLRARDELKSELRIARTVIQSAKNNPLKFSVSTDEALTKLLFPQEQGYMAPVEALREAIEDIKAHQMAMVAGLSAALTSIMEEFEPQNLEDRFQKNLKHSPMAALRGKSKYWEMYEEYYQQISIEAKSNILALYGEEFAKAYQDQVDKLS